MAKVDLRHAYRSVNIHPSNYAATGLKWNFYNSNKFTYLFDTNVSYGGRRAQEFLIGLCRPLNILWPRGVTDLLLFI